MTHIPGLLVILLLSLCFVAGAQTLGPVNCQWITAMAENGDTYTFNFTSLQSATHPPLQILGINRQWIWQLTMFNNFECAGVPAALCWRDQEVPGYEQACGIGFTSDTPAIWTKKSKEYPKGAVMFKLSEQVARWAHITVVCDPSVRYVSLTPFTALYDAYLVPSLEPQS